MSIINDALKKVQARLEKTHKKDKTPEPIPSQSPEPENVSTPSNAPWAGANSQATQAPQPASESKGPPSSSTKSFFLGLLLIVFGAGIIYALYAISSSPGKIAQKVPEPVKEVIKAIPVQEAIERVQQLKEPLLPVPQKTQPKPLQATPTPKPTNIKGLALNGIMMIEGRHVALINNIIYEHGDEVNGMTITSIKENGVELRNGRQVVELKLTK